MMSVCRKFIQIYRRDDGVTAIEFAIVGPVFFFLLLGMLEFGMIMLSQTIIENSTTITSRTARVGNDGGTGDLVKHIREEIRKNSYGFINTDEVLITTSKVAYGSLPKPEKCHVPAPVGTCPSGATFDDRNGNGVYDGDLPDLNLGNPGDRIEFRVHYPWKLIFPYAGKIFGDPNGEFIITTAAYVQNEPF